jgi:hypothetical protein
MSGVTDAVSGDAIILTDNENASCYKRLKEKIYRVVKCWRQCVGNQQVRELTWDHHVTYDDNIDVELSHIVANIEVDLSTGMYQSVLRACAEFDQQPIHRCHDPNKLFVMLFNILVNPENENMHSHLKNILARLTIKMGMATYIQYIRQNKLMRESTHEDMKARLGGLDRLCIPSVRAENALKYRLRLLEDLLDVIPTNSYKNVELVTSGVTQLFYGVIAEDKDSIVGALKNFYQFGIFVNSSKRFNNAVHFHALSTLVLRDPRYLDTLLLKSQAFMKTSGIYNRFFSRSIPGTAAIIAIGQVVGQSAEVNTSRRAYFGFTQKGVRYKGLKEWLHCPHHSLRAACIEVMIDLLAIEDLCQSIRDDIERQLDIMRGKPREHQQIHVVLNGFEDLKRFREQWRDEGGSSRVAHRYNTIYYGLSPNPTTFIQRPQYLGKIMNVLEHNHCVQLISNYPKSGKRALAAQYAQNNRSNYRYITQICADTKQEAVNELLHLSNAINVPNVDKSFEQLTSSFRHFFSKNKPSLFIIKGDYAPELYCRLVDHTATNDHRSDVIIIGGARDENIPKIDINALTDIEMKTLLRQSITDINERQIQGCISLLGGSPLAVSLLTHLINSNDCSDDLDRILERLCVAPYHDPLKRLYSIVVADLFIQRPRIKRLLSCMVLFGKVVDFNLLKYCTTTHKKQSILQSLSPLQSRLHLTLDSKTSIMCEMLVDVIFDSSVMRDKNYVTDTKNMVLRALKESMSHHNQLDYKTALAMKHTLMKISQINSKFDLTMHDIEIEMISIIMDYFNGYGDIDKANELAQVLMDGLEKRAPLSSKILYVESIYRLMDLQMQNYHITKNIDYIDIANMWSKTCISLTKSLKKNDKKYTKSLCWLMGAWINLEYGKVDVSRVLYLSHYDSKHLKHASSKQLQDRLKVREIIIRTRYMIEGSGQHGFNQAEYDALSNLNRKKYHRSNILMAEHIESKGLLLMHKAADVRRKLRKKTLCSQNKTIIELYKTADVLLDRANSLNHRIYGMKPLLQKPIIEKMLLCAERTNQIDRFIRLQSVLDTLSRNNLENNRTRVHSV